MPHYPKYQMVIDYVKKKISNNELKIGDKIPSEAEFSDMLGVSSITVRKAMSELVGSGLIYRVKGKGSFISDSSIHKEKHDKLVAFIFAGRSLGGSAYMQLIINMQKYFLKHGCSLIIENTDEGLSEAAVIQKLVEKHVEGFIIFSGDPVQSIPNLRYLDNRKIPFVMIDRYTPLYPANYVGSNNHDGAFNSVRYLLDRNHTGIAFLANNINLSSERERYEGYCDAYRSAGLAVNPDFLYKSAGPGPEQLLKDLKDGIITAVVGVNDNTTIRISRMIEQAGLNIPQDVSLVGFDDSDILKDTMIPLTTVKQFFDEIGYSAAKLLVSRINHSRHDFSHIHIGTKFIVRESTRENSAFEKLCNTDQEGMLWKY